MEFKGNKLSGLIKWESNMWIVKTWIDGETESKEFQFKPDAERYFNRAKSISESLDKIDQMLNAL